MAPVDPELLAAIGAALGQDGPHRVSPPPRGPGIMLATMHQPPDGAGNAVLAGVADPGRGLAGWVEETVGALITVYAEKHQTIAARLAPPAPGLRLLPVEDPVVLTGDLLCHARPGGGVGVIALPGFEPCVPFPAPPGVRHASLDVIPAASRRTRPGSGRSCAPRSVLPVFHRTESASSPQPSPLRAGMESRPPRTTAGCARCGNRRRGGSPPRGTTSCAPHQTPPAKRGGWPGWTGWPKSRQPATGGQHTP